MLSGLLGVALFVVIIYSYWQSRSSVCNRFRSIVEIQEEIILSWSTIDYKIKYANPATNRLFQESLVNKVILDYIYEDDRGWVKQKLSSLSPFAPKTKFQCRVVIPDRSVRKQIWQVHLTNLTEVQLIARDITEITLIEETLEKFERRSQALLESIPDSIFIFDREGNFVDFHCRLPEFSIDHPRLKDCPCFATISERILRLINITLATKQLQTLEFSYPDEKSHYEARLVPCGNEEVMMLVRDITVRKQSEAIALALRQEQEINSLQQHFFAVISHEFRTPLNVMAIAISALENNPSIQNDPKLKRNITRIKNGSDRILNTIDNMMTIYQIKTDFFVPNWQRIDFNSFCHDFIQQLDVGNCQAINFYPEEANPTLVSDPRLLNCILEQLLTNALKYSQSEIFVKLELQGNRIEVKISDQGIGIPEGEVSHIFEPFFRGSNVEKIHGSGLGLSLVQKCVEVCQGTIDVVSSPNGGTTFRLTFPLIPHDLLPS